MFAELVLPWGASVDRDAIEEALAAALTGHLEVTGAGTGVYGSNLDLEVGATLQPDALVAGVSGVLASFGATGAMLRIAGVEGWIALDGTAPA